MWRVQWLGARWEWSETFASFHDTWAYAARHGYNHRTAVKSENTGKAPEDGIRLPIE